MPQVLLLVDQLVILKLELVMIELLTELIPILVVLYLFQLDVTINADLLKLMIVLAFVDDHR